MLLKYRIKKKPDYLSSHTTAYIVQVKVKFIPFWITYAIYRDPAFAESVVEELMHPMHKEY